MGLLSNRIGKETLKVADHVYSWRAKRAYAHHGIYAGEDKVIHFTRRGGQEVGTGTSIDVLLASSSPIGSTTPCEVCSSYKVKQTNGVTCSCLSCFLAGGDLYRFEYAVSKAFFFAKVRGGTCTLATADPGEEVLRRANYLLANGFRDYSLFKNNCEDFAIYCKTGLIVAEQGSAAGIGQSGQAVSAVASGFSIMSVLQSAVLGTVVTRIVAGKRRGMLEEEEEEEEEVNDQVQKKEEEEEDETDGQERQAVSPGIKTIVVAASIITSLIAVPVVYCVARYKGDIGNRRSVLKIEVEALTARLASGQIRVTTNIGQLETPRQVQVPDLTEWMAA